MRLHDEHLGVALGARVVRIVGERGQRRILRDAILFRGVPLERIVHSYAHVSRPGLRFLRSTIRAIDPISRRVSTDDEELDADVLVIALGAETHPEATPGLVEGGHEFYTVAGAFALREVGEFVEDRPEGKGLYRPDWWWSFVLVWVGAMAWLLVDRVLADLGACDHEHDVAQHEAQSDGDERHRNQPPAA